MARLLAALLLLAPQDVPTSAPASFDRTVAIELGAEDPILAGHGPSQRIEHAVEFAGKLQIWTAVEGDLDTCLRVEDAAGKLLMEDDDSGGKPTPHTLVEVEPGQQLVIFVAASKPEGVGRVELHLVAAPETSGTLKAAEVARASIAKSQALASKNAYEAARTEITAAVRTLMATPAIHVSVAGIQALSALGGQAYTLGELEASQIARVAVVEDIERMLPPDHPTVQMTRWLLAWTLRMRGRLAEARALDEQVLEVRLRTLGVDHADVIAARATLGTDLEKAGELQRARELQEQVLEACTRLLPEDHSHVLWARSNLAHTLVRLGEYERALPLQEQVLAMRQRDLPEDHLELAWARAELAWTIGRLGDLQRAKELEEKVLQVRSTRLPEDHPEVQWARSNLAATLLPLGDPQRARDLQERVLEVYSSSLSPGHPDLSAARHNLALTVRVLGDLPRARRLLEQVVADRDPTGSSVNPEALNAQSNLAQTLSYMGDELAARALLERVVAKQEQVLPEGSPALVSSIRALASFETTAGRADRAIELLERLIAVQMRRAASDQRQVLSSRTQLAKARYAAGDYQGACTEHAGVLAAMLRTGPAENVFLSTARFNLGATLQQVGRMEEGRALLEEVLADEGRVLPRGASVFQGTRNYLILADLRNGRRESAERHCLEQAGHVLSDLEQTTLSLAPREAEGAAQVARGWISMPIVLALTETTSPRAGELARVAFTLVETARGVGLASREAQRAAAVAGGQGARAAELRVEVQKASTDLASLVTSGSGSAAEYQTIVRRKDAAERALGEAYAASGALKESRLRYDPAAIASALAREEVAVGFVVYYRPDIRPDAGPGFGWERHFAAVALSADGSVRWADLGARDRIEQAVERWRKALLAPIPRGLDVDAESSRADEERAAGSELVNLVIDPVRALCPEAKRWYVALDDALHLVPLDALPEGQGVVGDRLGVVVVPVLARIPRSAAPLPGPPTLLAMGGIEFDRAPLSGAPVDAASGNVARAAEPASRSALWQRGFPPLPDTVQEVRVIEALFRKTFEGAEGVQRVEDRRATKQLLIEQAPSARFLHLATHGYFAPESIASLADEPTTSQWVGSNALSFADQVKGMSPWVLCGLALAGANRPPDATGRLDGVITAEEVSAIDLSRCELAVLSACDTNVGVRRAGQGVASLQAALHAAGARSAITSLWKVPDEATKDLMIDFYRRVWVEEKPKLVALWEAKRKLREARDENGRLQYTLRDWAGWILTGDPR